MQIFFLSLSFRAHFKAPAFFHETLSFLLSCEFWLWENKNERKKKRKQKLSARPRAKRTTDTKKVCSRNEEEAQENAIKEKALNRILSQTCIILFVAVFIFQFSFCGMAVLFFFIRIQFSIYIIHNGTRLRMMQSSKRMLFFCCCCFISVRKIYLQSAAQQIQQLI